MTNFPEDDAREPVTKPANDAEAFIPHQAAEIRVGNAMAEDRADDARHLAETEAPVAPYAPPGAEPPLFHSYAQPPVRRPMRIPNFGHLLLLSLLLTVAFSILVIALALVSHFHLFGVQISASLPPTSASTSSARPFSTSSPSASASSSFRWCGTRASSWDCNGAANSHSPGSGRSSASP